MRSRIIVRSLTLAGAVIVLAVVTRASTLEGQGRPAAPTADVLPALLVEVRGLRAAMEQMASAGPRVQLALGRVQLQEQRVNTLVRRLEDLRTGVVEAQTQHDHEQQALRSIESELRNPRPGGPPVEMIKDQQEDLQRRVTGTAAKLQRSRAEEAAVAADLATEQARWTELNGRMEALEAALSPR